MFYQFSYKSKSINITSGFISKLCQFTNTLLHVNPKTGVTIKADLTQYTEKSMKNLAVEMPGIEMACFVICIKKTSEKKIVQEEVMQKKQDVKINKMQKQKNYKGDHKNNM